MEAQRTQMEAQQRQHREDLAAQQRHMEAQQHQMEVQQRQHKEDLAALTAQIGVYSGAGTAAVQSVAVPAFTPFEPTSELWADYWSRYRTFIASNAVPNILEAQVFLTNQPSTIYKQLANLAAQQTPPKNINDLTMDEIADEGSV